MREEGEGEAILREEGEKIFITRARGGRGIAIARTQPVARGPWWHPHTTTAVAARRLPPLAPRRRRYLHRRRSHWHHYAGVPSSKQTVLKPTGDIPSLRV